jgi:polyhydroxybutyrate depolymerase
MNHGGKVRTYTYYKPTTWSSGDQLPLLVVLHGLTQTGGGVMDITQFNQIAESNNFIVCYPNGINNAWNANMNVSISNADDKGFIETLIAYFQQNFNTNPNNQYLCGFSNGAFMSHKLACESNLCFAGIATVSGTMSDTVFSTCNPSNATSILHIHGTADAVVPYNGGPTTGSSVDQILEKWRNYLGCSLNPTSIDLPNTNLFDLSTAQRFTYSNCNGSSLDHIKIIGGGHQWPGINTWNGGVGTINMDFYSPQVIWDFLKTKSCTSSLSPDENNFNNIVVFPNPAVSYIHFKNLTEKVHIEIEDITGKIIISEILNPNNPEVNVGNIENGTYFVNIINPSTFENLKSIKLLKND